MTTEDKKYMLGLDLKYDPNIADVTPDNIATLNSRKILGEDARDILLDLLMVTVDLYKEVARCLKEGKGTESAIEVTAPFPCFFECKIGDENEDKTLPWSFSLRKNNEIIHIKYDQPTFTISTSTTPATQTKKQWNRSEDPMVVDPMLVAAITIIRCVLRKFPLKNYSNQIKFDDEFASADVFAAFKNDFPFGFDWADAKIAAGM